MREFIIPILYGVASLTGFFLAAFWFTTAVHRYKVLAKGGWKHDRYFILTASLGLMVIGNTLLYSGRAYISLTQGISPHLMGFGFYVISSGIIIALLGSVLIVRLSDIEKQPPRKWLWGIGAMATLWTVVVLYHLS